MESDEPSTLQSAKNLQPGDLVNETEAAAILCAQVQTLRNWRWNGKGPRYCKVGERLIRYRRSDLDAFLERGKAGTVAA